MNQVNQNTNPVGSDHAQQPTEQSSVLPTINAINQAAKQQGKDNPILFVHIR